MDIYGGVRFCSAMKNTLETTFRSALPSWIAETVIFLLKQAWAALFALIILTSVIFTNAIWADDWAMNRYDALFAIAVLTQCAMLLFKLETWQEAKVILLFHITGTAMEFFKVNAGSWSYPEDAIFVILNVPMFTGFMYASVGSYIARVMRIFDMRFSPYPPFWMTVVLAVAIYVNFFAHHFVMDIRLALFAATVLLYWRTKVCLTIGRRFALPLPLAAFMASFLLWIAENIGTLTGTWVYAGSGDFAMTSFSKMGSWYLLLYVAFVTVTLVIKDPLDQTKPRQTK